MLAFNMESERELIFLCVWNRRPSARRIITDFTTSRTELDQ